MIDDATPTEPGQARVRAQRLFRAYLGMIAVIHSGSCGWALVADALDDAAAEARERVGSDPGRPRP